VPGVSVTIIAFNESAHIEACIESVRWADEILVIDSGSTDGTPDLARGRGARVEVRDWPGYAAQKNLAASLATHDWILSIDADERVTPELAAEIRSTLTAPPTHPGFRLPRVTWHLGRWIRTTDWYPDYQLRLYDRLHARWTPRRVHESVETDAAPGYLTHNLQHYAYRDIAHHLDTINRYTTLAADEMRADGRRANLTDLVWHPPAAFLRNYLLRRGIMDGAPGFIISAMNTHYVFLKFAKLWALENTTSRTTPAVDRGVDRGVDTRGRK
jgi:glycosyltransferase involved in cell wall biosynthesis